MIQVGIDASDLVKMFDDLNGAAVKIGPAVRAVVSRGAVNIKKDAAARFEAQRVGAYLPLYSRSIDYDLESSGGVTTAVIGPNSDKVQGAFGVGIEYGSTHSAPLPHLNPALDAEDPKFEVALADAAVRSLS